MTLLEDVVDLSARRAEKSEKISTDAFADMKDDIDHVVAATVDQLQQSGMSEQESYKSVMAHLSDLVMAHDLG